MNGCGAERVGFGARMWVDRGTVRFGPTALSNVESELDEWRRGKQLPAWHADEVPPPKKLSSSP